MKRINSASVAALSLITIGIYSFVWLVKRRNEIVAEYKISLPSNGWVIGSAIASYAGTFIASTAIFLYVLNVVPSMQTTLAIVLAPFVVAYALGLWFMVPFSAAVANITGGRVPQWWTFLFYIPLYTLVAVVYQFFFNRITTKPPKTEKPVGPTPRFIALSFVGAVLAYSLFVVSYKDFPQDLDTVKSQTPALSQLVSEATELTKKADQLQQKHTACVTDLDKKYPGKLTSENEAAYQAGRDQCEQIRIEKDNTLEKINNLGKKQ